MDAETIPETDRPRRRRPTKPSWDTPCKLGTVPHLVRLHGADEVAPGRIVRVQTGENAPWAGVLVTKVNDDGHFFADLWLSDVPAGVSQRHLETGE